VKRVLWFKKKDGKPKAAVFVDYEHWYYGYRNNFQMKPNIEEWLEELKDEYDVDQLNIFGDFSRYHIGNDLERLKGITKNVIHTASDKTGVEKDFTDIIMLDAIYRSAADDKRIEVYILFTGDGHFTKVVQYLKELDKKVVIYGVKYGFSNRLKSEATSYVEMPRTSQEKNHYNELIFSSLSRLRYKPKTIITYGKTVKSVSDYNHVPYDKVKNALDGLLKQKYIQEREEVGHRGQVISVLDVDWERIEAEGLWETPQESKTVNS
jgi:uncharacterized LabA/DUF88 family protein